MWYRNIVFLNSSGFIIYKCALDCQKDDHSHCCYCDATYCKTKTRSAQTIWLPASLISKYTPHQLLCSSPVRQSVPPPVFSLLQNTRLCSLWSDHWCVCLYHHTVQQVLSWYLSLFLPFCQIFVMFHKYPVHKSCIFRLYFNKTTYTMVITTLLNNKSLYNSFMTVVQVF